MRSDGFADGRDDEGGRLAAAIQVQRTPSPLGGRRGSEIVEREENERLALRAGFVAHDGRTDNGAEKCRVTVKRTRLQNTRLRRHELLKFRHLLSFANSGSFLELLALLESLFQRLSDVSKRPSTAPAFAYVFAR